MYTAVYWWIEYVTGNIENKEKSIEIARACVQKERERK